ncbi:DNA-binding protein [Pseudomonas chlororaphis]|uniref:DNA-binding protein n=1 Tax=Pseudomonas chlororaphis TaxID=587753 RepID=UPI0019293E74|nr:DNA-binding protein [Pseudomonas chlororaphis]QQX57096.1 DNA-binding protein [Pseudomonas chlororaphis subsp. aurantiaca]
MARGGINKAVVQIARDALLARGRHPSIDAVRVELGNTGSKSTIQRYLKELGARERASQAPSPDEELHSFVAGLSARLKALAEEQVEDARQRLQRDRAAYEQQRLQQQVHLEHLQRANAGLDRDLQALREHERTLQDQLRKADGECQRLAQLEQNLNQLLVERAARIQSLEDKHRQAREALTHFRQQHLTQREQETQRHDTQVQQLQQELRALRNTLSDKQDELIRVFQDNERLVGELRTQHQQDHQRERQLQQLRQQCQDAETRQHSEHARVQSLTAEHASLRERVKHHVLKERQIRRELRLQRQQVARLQTLLSRSLPSPATPDAS